MLAHSLNYIYSIKISVGNSAHNPLPAPSPQPLTLCYLCETFCVSTASLVVFLISLLTIPLQCIDLGFSLCGLWKPMHLTFSVIVLQSLVLLLCPVSHTCLLYCCSPLHHPNKYPISAHILIGSCAAAVYSIFFCFNAIGIPWSCKAYLLITSVALPDTIIYILRHSDCCYPVQLCHPAVPPLLLCLSFCSSWFTLISWFFLCLWLEN